MPTEELKISALFCRIILEWGKGAIRRQGIAPAGTGRKAEQRNHTMNKPTANPSGAQPQTPNETAASRQTASPAGQAAAPETSRLRLKRILVPVDFSPPSRKALPYALSFAAQFGAEIILLHVVEPAIYPTEMGYVPAEIETMYHSMHLTTSEKLADLAREQVPASIPSQTMVRVGAPFQEITLAAQELKVDLIVIATHGYTGLKHVFMGSTAERVVRHAPCPVLTVREGEHDFV